MPVRKSASIIRLRYTGSLVATFALSQIFIPAVQYSAAIQGRRGTESGTRPTDPDYVTKVYYSIHVENIYTVHIVDSKNL